MISKAALPLLACVLASCAAKHEAPLPIPAMAEQRRCPAYPLPPAELIKPPVKTDFLRPTS
jgi:hypothetical protein